MLEPAGHLRIDLRPGTLLFQEDHELIVEQDGVAGEWVTDIVLRDLAPNAWVGEQLFRERLSQGDTCVKQPCERGIVLSRGGLGCMTGRQNEEANSQTRAS